jgi:hypothetical protein
LATQIFRILTHLSSQLASDPESKKCINAHQYGWPIRLLFQGSPDLKWQGFPDHHLPFISLIISHPSKSSVKSFWMWKKPSFCIIFT